MTLRMGRYSNMVRYLLLHENLSVIDQSCLEGGGVGSQTAV